MFFNYEYKSLVCQVFLCSSVHFIHGQDFTVFVFLFGLFSICLLLWLTYIFQLTHYRYLQCTTYSDYYTKVFMIPILAIKILLLFIFFNFHCEIEDIILFRWSRKLFSSSNSQIMNVSFSYGCQSLNSVKSYMKM